MSIHTFYLLLDALATIEILNAYIRCHRPDDPLAKRLLDYAQGSIQNLAQECLTFNQQLSDQLKDKTP